MVRVAGQRVRPVDGRAADRAVHVDRAGTAGQRREHTVVEVHAGARREQLQHSVDPVRDEPERQRCDGTPVEGQRASREVCDPSRQEEEVQHELHHPLAPLVERLLRLDVEEADEVDHEQRRENREHRHGRAREARRAPLERERDEEQDRQHVGDADRAVPSRRPSFHSTCSSASARVSAGTSSGGATRPVPVSRISSAAAPSGGTAARIGRSAARYSNTLPESTPWPRPLASGISSSNASESRCSASASRRETYGCSSSRSPRPSDSAHSRSATRKSPTKRATTSSSPDSASAERNGRGSRLPKKLPVCVMRKRSPRWYSSPAKSSKSAPLRIVVTTPAGSSERASSAIASEAATIASACRATSRATDALTFSFARTAARSTRRCGCVAIESRRSATQRAPVVRFTAAPIRWTEFGGDVVTTTSMPSARTIRTAAGIAVRFQLTFSSGTSTRRESERAWRDRRSRPRRPCRSSASLRARGPR